MEKFGQAMPVYIGRTASDGLASAPISICIFIDFQKAYDSVWLNGMFHKLSTKVNGSFLYT